VNPADEINARNAPSHPELLEWLTRDFSASGYDIRRFVRGILLTRAYALGAGEVPRGARLHVRLSDIDDITLDITGHLLALLDANDPMGTDASEALEEDDENAAGPIAIAEHHWGGWGMTREQLLRTLEEIERTVRPLNLETPVFRRDDFEGLERILFFDIQSRLQLSSAGMKALLGHLELNSGSSTEATWLALTRLEPSPDEFKKWCTHQDLLASLQGEEAPGHLFTETRPFPETEVRFCVRPWMKEILLLKPRLQSSEKARTQAVARLIRTLETTLSLPQLLQPLDRSEWHFQVKVMGFRIQKSTAPDLESSPWYLGLLGAEQDLTRTGIFGELRASQGLSTFEVQGRYLTDIQ
jgi:hypothetical protein